MAHNLPLAPGGAMAQPAQFEPLSPPPSAVTLLWFPKVAVSASFAGPPLVPLVDPRAEHGQFARPIGLVPGAPLGGLAGLSGSDAEDQQARLGAAFLAEVMGPRPSRPQRLSRGAAGLRDLIASVEAGSAGYDAVVYGATVPPPQRPSVMSLAEIRLWVAETPRQNHAIGRYQVVPRTFEGLVKRLGLPPGTRFNASVQDLMADTLIADAGYHEFLAGRLPRKAFMENLAAIWAALPRADGRSAYHGINGNRAGMTWARYEAAMAQIFPP